MSDELSRSLQHEIGALRRERARERRQQLAADRAADEERLRSAPYLGLSRGSTPQRPDLAGSLMRRIREGAGFDDASTGNLFSTNMLKDPMMETTLLSGNVTIGTSWTSIGAKWEARKRSVSGNVPTVVAMQTHRRKLMEGHIYRSDIVALDILYSGVGESWVELRPTAPAAAPVHIDWPWCVAAARIYIDKLIRPWTNLDGTDATEDEPNNFVRMALIDGGGVDTFEDPDFAGDEADLESLSDEKQETQVFVGSDTPDVTHWMAVQIHTLSLGAGGICVAVAEPQINYTYQEAPMPYEPVIGNWDPMGSGPTMADPVIHCSLVAATGGSLTLTSNGPGSEQHDGAPPGSGFTWYPPPTGNSTVHTQDCGSTVGYIYFTPAARPAWMVCPAGDIGMGYARHTGTWWWWNVVSLPSVTRAGLLLNFNVHTEHTHDAGKTLAVRVQSGLTAPSSLDSGALVASFTIPLGTPQFADVPMSCFIPRSLIPAVGERFWVGFTPVSRAAEGSWVCNLPAWPYSNGAGGSWGVDITSVSVAWRQYDCVFPAGSTIERFRVGIGNGTVVTFAGWPTKDGTVAWYVDGLLTEPLSYDAATGSVTFDRAVAEGAIVEQSGVAR